MTRSLSSNSTYNTEKAGAPMKKLDLGGVTQYDMVQLQTELLRLDNTLAEPTTIALCGSASVLLQHFDFRKAMGVDFCRLPDSNVMLLIEQLWRGNHFFDTKAAGIVGLFDDYEDRLVNVDIGARYLKVQCLSTRDWIVSKLASPKLDDVMNHPGVHLEDLLWVKEDFHKYCGVAWIRAESELDVLIKEFKQ